MLLKSFKSEYWIYIIFLLFLSHPQFPCLLLPLKVYICMCVYMCLYNLLHPFSVACMYMHLIIDFSVLKAYQGHIPREN